MSTETIMLIRDGEKGGKEYGGGERGTALFPLMWAAMRAI